MKKSLLTLTIVACALAVAVSAQEATPTATPVPNPIPETPEAPENTETALGLADCIKIGLEHNLDIQINRIAPQISQYSYSMAYGSYDPSLNASYSHGFSKNPAYQEVGTSMVTFSNDIFSDSLNTGLSMLSPSGGNVSLSGSYTRSGFSSAAYGYGNDDQFNASGTITMTQPLLKNMWIDSARLNIKVSKNNLQTSKYTYEYSLMTTIHTIENAYYSLIGARESVTASQQNLTQAQEFLDETRKKVELGSLIELDTKDAKSQVSAAKSSLIAARQSYKTAANTLRSLLSDDFTLWQDTDFNLTDELTSLPTMPSRADSWSKGLQLRPDFLQMKVDLETRNINLKYSYNQLFPQLDLVGSYGHSGARVNDSIAPFTQVGQGTYPRYTIGGELTLPLLNISARNTYKTRKAEREQSVLQLKQKEQNVMVEIDNAINSVNSSLEAIVSTREACQYAQEAWEAGKIRLEHGKATSFEVLQLQTTLFQRRLEEINALVSYNQNLANLRYTEGGTLESYNINVTYE